MDHFENEYRKSMEGYQPEVDTESIWNNIEPRLHPEKKRRFIFFWWLALLIPAFLGTWYVQTILSKTSVPFSSHNVVVPPTKESTVQGTEQTGLKKNTPEPETDHLAPSLNVPQKTAALSAQNDLPRHARTAALNTDPSASAIGTMPMQTQESEWKNRTMNSTMDKLVPLEMELTHNVEHLKFPKNPAVRGIKVHRPQWTPWIHAQAGIGVTKKSLQSRPEIRDGGSNLSDRKKTEKMLESITANVQWLMQHKHGFQTYLGIQYTLSNEVYQLAYQNTEKRTGMEVIEKVVDGSGQVIEEKSGLVTTTINTNYLKTTYNRYHFIDVPIGVGYAMSKGKTWWSYAGGIGLNLTMSFRGEQASGFGYTYQLSKGTATYKSVYKNAVGWNGWMRVQYNWRFRPNAFLFANLQTQIPFNSITVADYSLSQRHFQIGANAGIQIPLKTVNPKNKL